jgi:hypothetical protein
MGLDRLININLIFCRHCSAPRCSLSVLSSKNGRLRARMKSGFCHHIGRPIMQTDSRVQVNCSFLYYDSFACVTSIGPTIGRHGNPIRARAPVLSRPRPSPPWKCITPLNVPSRYLLFLSLCSRAASNTRFKCVNSRECWSERIAKGERYASKLGSVSISAAYGRSHGRLRVPGRRLTVAFLKCVGFELRYAVRLIREGLR